MTIAIDGNVYRLLRFIRGKPERTEDEREVAA